MQRTRRFLAVAESMARSIALLELNYLQNAGPSAVVDPVKRKSLADMVCQRVLSFTQSARFGEEEKATSLRSWQIVIAARCNSRLKMESRRLLFRRSVAAHMAIRFQKQRRSLKKPPEISSLP